MSFTQIAVLIVGIFLILFSQGPVTATLTLIFGIAVCALVLAEVILAHRP